MSILTRANTSNVKLLEKRLGEINTILERIEKTKQLTLKNQKFVGELIKGINKMNINKKNKNSIDYNSYCIYI